MAAKHISMAIRRPTTTKTADASYDVGCMARAGQMTLPGLYGIFVAFSSHIPATAQVKALPIAESVTRFFENQATPNLYSSEARLALDHLETHAQDARHRHCNALRYAA